ncbi:MAG: DUF4240 domain-containing protein [Myxococcota bacterium]
MSDLEAVMGQFPPLFWTLVSLSTEDLDSLRARLERYSNGEILRIYWTFEQALAELEASPWASEHRALTQTELRDLSSWIVGQGEKTYRQAWTDPSRLVEQPVQFNFVLLECIDDVWRSRNGRRLSIDPPIEPEDYLMKWPDQE